MNIKINIKPFSFSCLNPLSDLLKNKNIHIQIISLEDIKFILYSLSSMKIEYKICFNTNYDKERVNVIIGDNKSELPSIGKYIIISKKYNFKYYTILFKPTEEEIKNILQLKYKNYNKIYKLYNNMYTLTQLFYGNIIKEDIFYNNNSINKGEHESNNIMSENVNENMNICESDNESKDNNTMNENMSNIIDEDINNTIGDNINTNENENEGNIITNTMDNTTNENMNTLSYKKDSLNIYKENNNITYKEKYNTLSYIESVVLFILITYNKFNDIVTEAEKIDSKLNNSYEIQLCLNRLIDNNFIRRTGNNYRIIISIEFIKEICKRIDFNIDHLK